MMSLLPYWALNVSVPLLSMQGQKALGFHQKYLHLCSEDERRFYGIRTRWGWIINDKIFIFGWTISLTLSWNVSWKCFYWYSCLNKHVIGSYEGLEVYIFFQKSKKPYAALSKLTSQTEKSSILFPCSLITCMCMRPDSWLLNPLGTPVCLWVCGCQEEQAAKAD